MLAKLFASVALAATAIAQATIQTPVSAGAGGTPRGGLGEMRSKAKGWGLAGGTVAGEETREVLAIAQPP